MIKTLKELISERRVEASDRAYNNQTEFRAADEIEDLQEAVKKLTGRLDAIDSFQNIHDAEFSEVYAAIDVLTEACTDLHKVNVHIAERLVDDEELIGIDDESDHPWADDCTISDNVAIIDGSVTALRAAVENLYTEREHTENRIGELREIIINTTKLNTESRISTLESDLKLMELSMDAKLGAYQQALDERLAIIQDQINKKPEL